MASRNFVSTFKAWQKIGDRREVPDPKYEHEIFVYYGTDLAEESCTQVAIVSLEEVEAQRKVAGYHGQMNYKDENDYDERSCLTKRKDFNYACTSFLKRAMYTQEAFDILKKYNEEETVDWGDDYKRFVEEVMNVTGAIYRMMYKCLDGAKTMHPYDVLYNYKLQRMTDARDNLAKRKCFLQMQQQNGFSDGDEEMREFITDHGNMAMSHSTKSHTADDSGMANASELSHTPAQPLLSANMDISNVPVATGHNDKASGSGFDYNSFMSKAKLNDETSAFAREWQRLYGTPGPGEKDVVSMEASFAMLERYHDRRHDEFLKEGIDPEMVTVMEGFDRAIKNVIWKKDVKAHTINNIMTVMDDTDTMNMIFDKNPEFLTKAFGMMANANVLQKLQKTSGFKSEWLTSMELAIATNKKLNATNAVAPEEGVSQLETSQKNNKVVHDAEDMPIGQTFTRTSRKPGGGDLISKRKSKIIKRDTAEYALRGTSYSTNVLNICMSCSSQ